MHSFHCLSLSFHRLPLPSIAVLLCGVFYFNMERRSSSLPQILQASLHVCALGRTDERRGSREEKSEEDRSVKRRENRANNAP